MTCITITFKEHCVEILDLCFILELYLGIFIRPSMFLESSIWTSNLPKSLKMYLHQYWRNHILVLTKYTGIDQIIYRYWQNCLLKSDMRFFQYWYKIAAKPVHDLANNGIWFCQSQCTILEIPEYDFVNTGEDTFSKILGQNQRF